VEGGLKASVERENFFSGASKYHRWMAIGALKTHEGDIWLVTVKYNMGAALEKCWQMLLQY